MSVSWNGSFLGLSGKQDKTNSGKAVYTIPEQSKFCVVDVNKNTENTVYISFSKDLDPTQNINDFVKDAPQFDDITMLAFDYFGSENA